MPNPPNVDGLPVWLQIVVSLAFGLATVLVGLRGYFRQKSPSLPVSATPSHVLEAAVLSRLTDVSKDLSGEITTLERTMSEHTYHLRESNEICREVCQRLRELRERLDRGDSRGL